MHYYISSQLPPPPTALLPPTQTTIVWPVNESISIRLYSIYRGHTLNDRHIPTMCDYSIILNEHYDKPHTKPIYCRNSVVLATIRMTCGAASCAQLCSNIVHRGFRLHLSCTRFAKDEV